MSVTHFEIRGRVKKQNPRCPWCLKELVLTTRKIVMAGGADKVIFDWARHVEACVTNTANTEPVYIRERWHTAMIHMADIGRIVWGYM